MKDAPEKAEALIEVKNQDEADMVLFVLQQVIDALSEATEGNVKNLSQEDINKLHVKWFKLQMKLNNRTDVAATNQAAPAGSPTPEKTTLPAGVDEKIAKDLEAFDRDDAINML